MNVQYFSFQMAMKQFSTIKYYQYMKSHQIVAELAKSPNLNSLLAKEVYQSLAQIKESQIVDAIKQYFPKLVTNIKGSLQSFIRDQEFYNRLQRLCQFYCEFQAKAEVIEQQIVNKTRQTMDQKSIGINKKITRAALARRHQKTQEEIRKDQIFIRLTPKSQACIQFMLCNRNFPRMEVKLSCNQHLQYLINYLTNKWLRGKVGYKIILYPDNSFLKTIPVNQKEKAFKQPFNNYLMFTDIMSCCGVNQNGVLNMTYEIVQSKKQASKQLLITPQNHKNKNKFDTNRDEISSSERIHPKQNFHYPQLSNNFGDKTIKADDRQESLPIKNSSPVKYTFKDDLLPQYGIFNKNSNFYPNGEESMLGSLGFNFNFGNGSKKDDNHYSVNSMNYLNPFLQDFKRSSPEQLQKDQGKKLKFEQKAEFEGQQKLESQQKLKSEHEDGKQNSQQLQKIQEKSAKEQMLTHDKKLGNLISILDIIEKEKDRSSQQLNVQEPQNNNSNRFKEVKTVNIVKKKTNNA